MKYKVGDRVVNIVFNKIATIKGYSPDTNFYDIKYDDGCLDRSLENELLTFVEWKTKPEPKFKVGDRIYSKYHKPSNDLEIIEVIQGDGHYGYRIKNHHINNTYCMWEYEMSNYILAEEEMKSENELLDEYEELTDRAFKGGYEKCQLDILLNGYELPEGYIFKDQTGNEIHALKIVLEKANTLKIQSDNMETETHRGYYTTEEDNTNKSKKVAWFTFWDNDFADKVELDLSGRELIQEDGKWFVVKKKKAYPKTFEECCKILGLLNVDLCFNADYRSFDASKEQWKRLGLMNQFYQLLICRDAYWKIAGEEMGLDKPWEPDYDSGVNKYGIICMNGVVQESNPTTNWERHLNKVLDFPTKEMRDAFKENFKELIESVKELL